MHSLFSLVVVHVIVETACLLCVTGLQNHPAVWLDFGGKKRQALWGVAFFFFIRKLLFCTLLLLSPYFVAHAGTITIASTTSTANSGLLDVLLPLFHSDTQIHTQVVAVGTGKAIRIAEAGDADVLFVHHPEGEKAFVAAGFGVTRHEVMYNDFVIVGPQSDPAAITNNNSAILALKNIAQSTQIFTSRGDDSGTHRKERSLWQSAGVDVDAASGSWYRETGSGMGATLNIASGMNAYALTDRATWLKFGNKGDLALLFADDPALFNQYAVVAVNPEKHPHVNIDDAQAFINWLTGDAGQTAINAYRIAEQQAFFANATP